jgi:hypothetical protein
MNSLVQFFLVPPGNTSPMPALSAGWRNALRLVTPEATGYFLVDLTDRIALHAARSALAGTANLHCGNLPFDAQAAVFAHG